MLAKIIGAGLGIYFIANKVTSSLAPVSIVAIAIIAELFQWRSDVLKGRGEGITRKVEYQDAFGWTFPNKDLSDHLAKIPARTRRAIAQAVKDNYFASQEPPGPRRAAENLQESAWWSKDLAGFMLSVCAVLTAVLFVGALAALSVSVATIRDYDALQSVNRVVTSVIALIISLGFLKLIVGYYNFASKAEQTERCTITMLKSKKVDQTEAIQLLHEYQIARSAAPFIPDLAWRLSASTLNELWAKYRRGQAR